MAIHWGGKGPGHLGRNGLAASSAVAATTWNPADKNAAIVLSNGNLTATGSGAARESARGTTSKTTGKWYFEGLVITGTDPGIGLANATAALNEWIGATVNSTGYHGSGFLYYNNVDQGAVAAYFNADRVSVAADLDLRKMWVYKNNVLQGGNPVAGTGGATLPAGALFPFFFSEAGTGASMTASFGAAALTYTPPTGFAAWG